jgi:hypothetical protein
MPTLRQLITLIATVACGSATAFSDLCKDPELLHQTPVKDCRSERVLYRSNGVTDHATIAAVVTGYQRRHDVISRNVAYFVRLPSGQLVRADNLPYPSDYTILPAQRRILQLLGIGPQSAAWNDLYDRIVEEASSQFCMIYRMKPPFVGEIQDCDGRNPQGSVAYAPQAISAREASRTICRLIESETSQPCGNNSVSIISTRFVRDGDGGAHYRLVARRRIREYPELKETTSYGSSIPVEYDERTYRFHIGTGQISLLSQSALLCSSRCRPMTELK